MVFQAMFRNPLATPFTLGVSSGASLGAAISHPVQLDLRMLGISERLAVRPSPGAVVSIVLVYLSDRPQPPRLVLGHDALGRAWP